MSQFLKGLTNVNSGHSLCALSACFTTDSVTRAVGLDHLLQVEGQDNPSETKMACFMGLLSQLAAKPEVLHVSALHRAQHHSGVARAVVESATTTETPLSDAGLDGTGEVIQARHFLE